MQALESIIAALILGLSAVLMALTGAVGSLFPTEPIAPPAPAPAETASFPAAPSATSTATSTKVAAAKEPVKAAVPTTEPKSHTATSPVATAPAAIAPQLSQEVVNNAARAALVNILCMSNGTIPGLSGSGVIIDSRGVILTNAHVAQYFLLQDFPTKANIECVVRTGSPAEARYTAELLYIPPAWVAANASQLRAAKAIGTGEHDYAFVRITGRTDGSALPASFPHLEMDARFPEIGEPMLLASYPAGFLGTETIQKSLYASSAVTYTTQLFTFDDNRTKVDLFSIGGTVLSQGGSSGGAVLRLKDGKLAGLIATATVADSTGGRDLRAITFSHINNSLEAAGMGGIAALLVGNVAAKAATFNAQVAPGLTAQLEAVLR